MDYKEAIDILNDTESDMKYDQKEVNEAHLLAIQVLEKQAFFENEVSNIHDWFVDNKDSLLDSAMTVARNGFIESNADDYIDQVDLDFIVEDIVEEIQKRILNVLSTYMGDYDA